MIVIVIIDKELGTYLNVVEACDFSEFSKKISTMLQFRRLHQEADSIGALRKGCVH